MCMSNLVMIGSKLMSQNRYKGDQLIGTVFAFLIFSLCIDRNHQISVHECKSYQMKIYNMDTIGSIDLVHTTSIPYTYLIHLQWLTKLFQCFALSQSLLNRKLTGLPKFVGIFVELL